MTWEIVGRSAASNIYADKQQFIDVVLHPFANRFRLDAPLRPVHIRGIYEDEDASAVIVVWDGKGTTIAGTSYTNTYAWIMKLRDAKVVDAMAYLDATSRVNRPEEQRRVMSDSPTARLLGCAGK
jgi:uncharacterized protein